ncbi:MAG: InlB B-repeat-containing protein, partial [Lachnospiraceae bacterium]|nr:InlB B-repeat-containing protein [Lachnospiraceae bacterium]
FLCNKQTAGNAVGTEYFLTYTVESATSSGSQNGFLGTSAPETQFPYTEGNGLLYYQQRKSDSETPELLMEGYTYFIKFTVTDSGYRYLAARAKGNSSEYFVIERKAATGNPKSTNYGYFGLWFGDGVTDAHLSHVRFYDAAGNDLGVWSPRSLATVKKAGPVDKDTEAEHWYRVEAVSNTNLAISNEKPLTTDKMYMEFTVAEADTTCNQSGIAFSNYPNNTYPHSNGQLRYQSIPEGSGSLLLEPGADYMIVLEKGKFSFTAYVQITTDGNTTTKVFPNISGTYDDTAQYFSLWFGTGANYKSSFVLENVKVYDSQKNNLGIQSNSSQLQVRHFGAVLDYAACEAIYYCQESGNSYTLYADQTMKLERQGMVTEGTYRVSEGKITITVDGQPETFDYLYSGFTVNDQYFKRLYNYQVRFVAGNGSEDQIQYCNMENGYYVTKPANPELKGCTFEGWCTIDGTAYDFDEIVTQSKIVYAKWTNNAGVTYLAVEGAPQKAEGGTNTAAVVISVLMVMASVVAAVLIIRGGFKRDKNTK